MTKAEHLNRHIELHRMFDELTADWIRHNVNAYLSKATVLELIQWSHSQTQEDSIIHGEEVKE